jgi:hypothetical protein
MDIVVIRSLCLGAFDDTPLSSTVRLGGCCFPVKCRSTIPTVCTGAMVAPTLSAAAPPPSPGVAKARNSFRSLHYLRAALRSPPPQVSCGPVASPEPAGCPMPGWPVKSPLGSPLKPGWSPASETPPLCACSWPPSSFRRATKTILLFN